MSTAPKTVRTYTLDGTKKDFTIPFEYLARKFVTVTLIGTTRKELVLITDYRFTTSTQITTNKAWGPGDGYEMIEIRRLTSATERLVDFADGSILRAYDLNISQVQSLHIAEEARDLTADTIAVNNDGDLDARGRRIVNLADAALDGDAVTLRQEKAWSASALNQANRSEQQANIATEKANIATEQNRQATIKASESARHAGNSKDDANRSVQAYQDSANAMNVSIANAALSKAYATSNEGSPVQPGLYSSFHYSRKSANSAAQAFQDANRATTQADRATTQADRAKMEADRLGNANAFMNTILDVRNLDTRFKGTHQIKQALYVQRQSSDDVNDFVSLSFEPNRVWYTRDSSNTALTSLDPAGNYASKGSITADGGSVTVRAPVESYNCHYWFEGPGVSRGVIYAGNDQNIHIRAGSSHVGLSVTPAGDIVARGSILMNSATIQANADIFADWIQGGSLGSALRSVKSGTRIKNVPVVIWERGVDGGGVGDPGAPNSQIVLREPLLPGDFYMFEIYGAAKFYSTTNCIPYGDSTTEEHNVQFDAGGAMLFTLTEGGKRITVRAGKPNNQYGIRRVFLFKLQLA